MSVEVGEKMTLEEYREQMKITQHGKYTKIDVECPKCGERLYRDNSIVLTTYPPQHRLECFNCKFTTTV